MAIEALLDFNPNFIHKPWHDLELIVYIILYICTFVKGPGLVLTKSDIPSTSLPIWTWFSNDQIREIGFRKLAHLKCYDHTILPHFTPYWRDFTPFVEDLIIACFPVKPRLPNQLQYEQAIQILEKAYDAVEEPAMNDLSPSRVSLKRPNTSSLCQDSKKGKQVP